MGVSVRSLAPLAGILCLVACGSSASDAPPHSVVDGVWSTSCMTRQDLFSAFRLELQLQNASRATRIEYYYDDAACTEALAVLSYEGDYELMVTARDFIYGIDFFFAEQGLAALNDKGQERLEEAAFCGHKSWPLAVAMEPLNFDPGHCTAVGPVPLKNLNLVEIHRGFSLKLGSELAHENERPIEVQDAPPLVFFSQPSH